MLRKGRNDDCMVVMQWQPEGKRKVVWPKTTWRRSEWEKNPDKRGGPAGWKSGVQHKTGLVGSSRLTVGPCTVITGTFTSRSGM